MLQQPQQTQMASIRSAIEAQLDGGLLTAGMKLPAERTMSELFATTRITLREALLSLEAEGRIYREERRGWFVSPPRLIYDPRYKSHFHEMVENQQRQVQTSVLAFEPVLATPALCREMALPALSPLYRIQRRRQVDGRAVVFVEHFLLPTRFPGLEKHDLSASLTRLYNEHYQIRYGRSRFHIYPTAARGIVATQLNLAEGCPVLLIVRVNYDEQGELIDCDREYWRHDAVCISVDSQTGT